jgi:LysM repeat protein
VPTASPTPSPEPGTSTPVTFYYTAKPGDTLESIAAKFGTTADAILQFNHNLDPDEALDPGTVIAIPVGFEGGALEGIGPQARPRGRRN